MLRIQAVEALGGWRLRLTLTDGSVIERDLAPLLRGPVFEAIRNDERRFYEVSTKGGTVVWPNGADLCPDRLIWGGLPREDGSKPPARIDFSRGDAAVA